MYQKYLFVIFILAFWLMPLQLVNAKSRIKMLTSAKMANKVASKIPTNAHNTIEINRHSVGIGIGQTYLSGDFKDHGNNSILGDVYYVYNASYSFDMVANIHYSYHKRGIERVKLPGAGLGLRGKFFQFDSFSPYLLGGLGFYRPTVSYEGRSSDAKIVMGLHTGAGIHLNLNRNYSMGFLGHYHLPFKVPQDYERSIRGSYFKLLMVAFYTF